MALNIHVHPRTPSRRPDERTRPGTRAPSRLGVKNSYSAWVPGGAGVPGCARAAARPEGPGANQSCLNATQSRVPGYPDTPGTRVSGKW
eukprot:2043039-Rhodomonas_salina.3